MVMRLTRLILKNWKNFVDADIALAPRVFIIGNNGTGKSNLMDALRFLRDIANPKGGGLQSALEKRGGIKQVRSLFARRHPHVKISVDAVDERGEKSDTWRYELSIHQEQRGLHRCLVESETVLKNNNPIFERPGQKDRNDPARLTQTGLEQTMFNQNFRTLAEFFRAFKYSHIVPQLIRHGSEIQGKVLPDDPFGQDFMNAIAGTHPGVQARNLNKIGRLLTKVKPEFSDTDIGLKFVRDPKTGKPHLEFKYPTWRSHASRQTEGIFSDGELRLIGLLWTLLEKNSVTLLEEPELSFNEGIISQISDIFDRVMGSKKKGKQGQIILSTHSHALLDDPGIVAEEIVLLRPEGESTKAICGADDKGIAANMKAGVSAANAVLRFAQNQDIGKDIGGIFA